MSAMPLVSVMTPCYEAAATLPRALASLVAQTYPHWECIVVDDGSRDDPQSVVDALGDDRVRLLRFATNRGRGAARQAALDSARGELLAMLDADDWLYPEKLALQVQVLQGDQELALVSGGMAIVDASGALAGVRSQGSGPPTRLGPLTRLATLSEVAHAPSMLRRSACRGLRFDPSLRVAEDVDFLLRVLLDRCFSKLPEAVYAYHEYDSLSLPKLLASHESLRQLYRKHALRFPLQCRIRRLKSRAKALAYRCAFAAGLGERLISTRCAPPSAGALAAFEAARRRVDATVSARFGGDAP